MWDNVPSRFSVKVVIHSSSLIFTVLSIILNVPITRVKKKAAIQEESQAEAAESG
jgi:hypothetical protein